MRFGIGSIIGIIIAIVVTITIFPTITKEIDLLTVEETSETSSATKTTKDLLNLLPIFFAVAIFAAGVAIAWSAFRESGIVRDEDYEDDNEEEDDDEEEEEPEEEKNIKVEEPLEKVTKEPVDMKQFERTEFD